jgi:hypothetical protein
MWHVQWDTKDLPVGYYHFTITITISPGVVESDVPTPDPLHLVRN